MLHKFTTETWLWRKIFSIIHFSFFVDNYHHDTAGQLHFHLLILFYSKNVGFRSAWWLFWSTKKSVLPSFKISWQLGYWNKFNSIFPVRLRQLTSFFFNIMSPLGFNREVKLRTICRSHYIVDSNGDYVGSWIKLKTLTLIRLHHKTAPYQ